CSPTRPSHSVRLATSRGSLGRFSRWRSAHAGHRRKQCYAKPVGESLILIVSVVIPGPTRHLFSVQKRSSVSRKPATYKPDPGGSAKGAQSIWPVVGRCSTRIPA